MFGHLYDLLRERAARLPDAVAVGGQDGLIWKSLDSRELLERVDRLADELAALGVSDGDRVVLWLPNHWRTPCYLFAVWKLGAIAVPFDREMNPEGGARILQSVEQRLHQHRMFSHITQFRSAQILRLQVHHRWAVAIRQTNLVECSDLGQDR